MRGVRPRARITAGLSVSPPVVRRGEYAARGDYHRAPDPDWDYYPTYLAKLTAVRAWLNTAPRGARVLDAGCGEGVLVEEYAERLRIEGIDPNYSSGRVRAGSLTALPFANGTFDRALSPASGQFAELNAGTSAPAWGLTSARGAAGE